MFEISCGYIIRLQRYRDLNIWVSGKNSIPLFFSTVATRSQSRASNVAKNVVLSSSVWRVFLLFYRKRLNRSDPSVWWYINESLQPLNPPWKVMERKVAINLKIHYCQFGIFYVLWYQMLNILPENEARSTLNSKYT